MRSVAHIAATTVFVLAVGYYQVFSLKAGREQTQRVVPFSALISATQAGVARSERPELYGPGEQLGFVLVGDATHGARETILFAIQYALAPARLEPSARTARVVVFFTAPSEIARFEAENAVRLLDTLTDNVRVYHRERN